MGSASVRAVVRSSGSAAVRAVARVSSRASVRATWTHQMDCVDKMSLMYLEKISIHTVSEGSGQKLRLGLGEGDL